MVLSVPTVPVLAEDTGYSIWQIGNRAIPRAVNSTRESFLSGNYLSDPEASPVTILGIPTEFVYGWVGAGSGIVNEIHLVSWDDSSNTVIATTPNGHSFPVIGNLGTNTSPYPSWHPDGSKVVFVRPDFLTSDPTIGQKIKTVDRDGTNETQLFEATTAIAPSLGNNDFVIYNPLYNSDGTKIAFVVSNDVGGPLDDWYVCVIDADGSNLVVAHSSVHPKSLWKSVSWANTDPDTLTFVEFEGTLKTDDEVWRTVQSDGTGDTEIYRIDRSGRTTFFMDPGPLKWSWLSDDSSIVTALGDESDFHYEAALIDPGGGGVTMTGINMGQASALERFRPAAIASGNPFTSRIYLPIGVNTFSDPIDRVDSVLEDLTDQITDLEGTNFSPVTEFDGFKGDNLIV